MRSKRHTPRHPMSDPTAINRGGGSIRGKSPRRGGGGQPTRLAPNGSRKTRRGYILMTADLVGGITNSHAIDDGTVAVHQRVTVTTATKIKPYRAPTFTQVPPITAPPAGLNLTRNEWVTDICTPNGTTRGGTRFVTNLQRRQGHHGTVAHHLLCVRIWPAQGN